MEAIITLLIILVVLFTLYKLGAFQPLVHLTNVANREATVYDRSHKVAVGKRYQNMTADLDADKINSTIKTIDGLNFD